jgi:hypothetical protein
LIDLNQIDPAPIRYDLDEIVRRLRGSAERWVPALFPKGRRQGDEWRLANIQGAPPRKSGSCVIMLRGDHAGDWHEFDGGQGGLAVMRACPTLPVWAALSTSGMEQAQLPPEARRIVIGPSPALRIIFHSAYYRVAE